MAKRRRLNFELVLVQGCSFNIKMGGVGLGFGLIIAGFQHGFLGNFGLGESGIFGNFASGVNISCQIKPATSQRSQCQCVYSMK